MAIFLVTPSHTSQPVEVEAEDFGITQTGALFFQNPATGSRKLTMAAFAPGNWISVLSMPGVPNVKALLEDNEQLRDRMRSLGRDPDTMAVLPKAAVAWDPA